MIRLCCPRGHFIADVNINGKGHVIPRGVRHGLSWGYNPDRDISCIRAQCRRCGYDASLDYVVLCTDVGAAAAAGHAEHRLTA